MAGIVFEMQSHMGHHIWRRPDGTKQDVRAGDRITVEHEEELGAARNKYRRISPDAAPVIASAGLVVEKRSDDGYDVVNPDTNKAINDTALTLEEARAMSLKPRSGSIVQARSGSSKHRR